MLVTYVIIYFPDWGFCRICGLSSKTLSDITPKIGDKLLLYSRKLNKFLKLLTLSIAIATITSINLGLAELPAKTSEKADLIVLEANAHKVISSQIDAFRKLDINTAYAFASPFIKSKFTNAENFGEMVRSGYPMIWAPNDYKFLDFNAFNGFLIQRVLFVDSQERIFVFDYELKKYSPDRWLINGVFPVQSSISGA